MNTRKSVHIDLNKYCHFAQPEHFIEVCEWTNAEGFTVTLENVSGKQLFDLTYGEFQALKNAIATLNYHS